MPYHVGLQVLRGVYPEASVEGVVPSQNLCQNRWWDGVLLKNCVESCRVAIIIAQQPTQTITIPRLTAVAPDGAPVITSRAFLRNYLPISEREGDLP